jgi:hypothetical protein
MILSLPQSGTQRQRLGRAIDRDRAGSTGRAGWSRAGKRLANFFIGGFLIAGNSHLAKTVASVPESKSKSR